MRSLKSSLHPVIIDKDVVDKIVVLPSRMNVLSSRPLPVLSLQQYVMDSLSLCSHILVFPWLGLRQPHMALVVVVTDGVPCL